VLTKLIALRCQFFWFDFRKRKNFRKEGVGGGGGGGGWRIRGGGGSEPGLNMFWGKT